MIATPRGVFAAGASCEARVYEIAPAPASAASAIAAAARARFVAGGLAGLEVRSSTVWGFSHGCFHHATAGAFFPESPAWILGAGAAAPLIELRVCGKRPANPVQLPTQAKRFYVTGSVQGVGFRFFAQRAATRLGITGYVKNIPDGRVEVYAIGQPPQLEALRSELNRGPRSASISEIVEEAAEKMQEHLDRFEILPGGW